MTKYNCPCGTTEFDMVVGEAPALKASDTPKQAVFVKIVDFSALKRIKYCPACGAKATINK